MLQAEDPLSMFEGILEPELIQELQQVGEQKRISAGQTLMEVGQTITHMPLVLKGSIKVMTVDEQGDELLLYYLETGDTCAMTLQCCTRKASSNIQAVVEEDVLVVFIPVDHLARWMGQYESWREFVLQAYHMRMTELFEAVDNLAFHDMRGRLIKYLRDKAMVHSSADLHITHHQIAQDLHSSRVVISRLLKSLERDGLVSQGRGRVEVLEFSAS